MGVEHERLAAAAVCALASLVSDSTREGHRMMPYGISWFHKSWQGLPRCLAAAVVRPAVADAADAWRPHSVAAAACFAVAQAVYQHGGRVPPASVGVQGLWPALPRVGAAAAAAGGKLTDPESFPLIGAACNFANGLVSSRQLIISLISAVGCIHKGMAQVQSDCRQWHEHC